MASRHLGGRVLPAHRRGDCHRGLVGDGIAKVIPAQMPAPPLAARVHAQHELRRLANVLVLERPTEPAGQPRLFATPRANRITAVMQVLLGIWVLVGCVQVGWLAWNQYGGGRDKPELYGIWSVTTFGIDGKPVAPLTTDETRWQRLVFDESETVTHQRMDGDLISATAEVGAGTITRPELPATFNYERSGPDHMRLDGRLDDQAVTMSLERIDLDSFTLRSRGFNWLQEYPYFN